MQPKSATKTRRVHSISSQQPSTISDAFHAANTVEPSSRSLKPAKSPIKSISTQKHDLKVGGASGQGAAGKKQAASQKVTVDSSQKVKFAIVNSQNTSMQMNLSQRQPGRGGRVTGKETSSLAVDRKSHGKPDLKASRLSQERRPNLVSSEGSESRPFSHPTVMTDSHISASSYQRYVMSQTTDYRNIDSSNLTTKAANTPAPIIIEQGVSVSVSGVDSSFQPSKIDFSSKSYESFQGDETSEGSDTHSQSVSQLEGETDSESYSRPESSGSHSMADEQLDSLQGEMVSKPQSGRVTIEVDMRFSSSIDRPGSELSQLSSSLAGGADGLSMSAVSEQSRTASSLDGSQLHKLPHEVGSEVDVGAVESDQGSQLDSASALSIGASEGRSSRQESERREEGEDFHEGAAEMEKYGTDMVEFQASKLAHVFQHQEDERDSQPCSGSMSKRSSISYQSDIDSHPRSEHLSSAISSRIDPMEHGDLNMEQQYFDRKSKTVVSLERLEEAAPTISKPADPSISDRKLSGISTTQLQASETLDIHNHTSKSSTMLQASQSSSDHKLSSPCSLSLSSIGMPPYSVPSQGASTTTSASSRQQYHSLTPSQSVTTASQTRSQRSSFGSVQSSVPSIKPSATHMIEGLQHLSTSGLHADTSSWLLAHHSGSRIRSEFPASEERDRDTVDIVEGEDRYDKESIKDVKSKIEVDDSKSLLSENLQHESQAQLRLQTFGSRESNSICLSAQDADKTEQPETQTDIRVDEGGVSVPTMPVEPPEIKVVVSSESQESALIEGTVTMADLADTRVDVKDSDMVDTEDSGKSKEKSDSTSANLAVSILQCHVHVYSILYL